MTDYANGEVVCLEYYARFWAGGVDFNLSFPLGWFSTHDYVNKLNKKKKKDNLSGYKKKNVYTQINSTDCSHSIHKNTKIDTTVFESFYLKWF